MATEPSDSSPVITTIQPGKPLTVDPSKAQTAKPPAAIHTAAAPQPFITEPESGLVEFKSWLQKYYADDYKLIADGNVHATQQVLQKHLDAQKAKAAELEGYEEHKILGEGKKFLDAARYNATFMARAEEELKHPQKAPDAAPPATSVQSASLSANDTRDAQIKSANADPAQMNKDWNMLRTALVSLTPGDVSHFDNQGNFNWQKTQQLIPGVPGNGYEKVLNGVQAFQQSWNKNMQGVAMLRADGVADPATRSAIDYLFQVKQAQAKGLDASTVAKPDGLKLADDPSGSAPSAPLLTETRSGQRGADVTALQEKLHQVYPLATIGSTSQPLKPDGVYGSKTEAAVKKFQHDNQLPETGMADKATLAKLNEVTGAKPGAAPLISMDEMPSSGIDYAYTDVPANAKAGTASLPQAPEAGAFIVDRAAGASIADPNTRAGQTQTRSRALLNGVLLSDQKHTHSVDPQLNTTTSLDTWHDGKKGTDRAVEVTKDKQGNETRFEAKEDAAGNITSTEKHVTHEGGKTHKTEDTLEEFAAGGQRAIHKADGKVVSDITMTAEQVKAANLANATRNRNLFKPG